MKEKFQVKVTFKSGNAFAEIFEEEFEANKWAIEVLEANDRGNIEDIVLNEFTRTGKNIKNSRSIMNAMIRRLERRSK